MLKKESGRAAEGAEERSNTAEAMSFSAKKLFRGRDEKKIRWTAGEGGGGWAGCKQGEELTGGMASRGGVPLRGVPIGIKSCFLEQGEIKGLLIKAGWSRSAAAGPAEQATASNYLWGGWGGAFR